MSFFAVFALSKTTNFYFKQLFVLFELTDIKFFNDQNIPEGDVNYCNKVPYT